MNIHDYEKSTLISMRLCDAVVIFHLKYEQGIKENRLSKQIPTNVHLPSSGKNTVPPLTM